MIAREQAPTILEQKFRQLVLSVLELNGLVMQVHRACHRVETVGLKLQAHGGGVWIGATHQGRDARHEFLHTQRLDHEVICAGMKGRHDVLFFVALAGKQDGLFAAASFTQRAHHLNAAEAG